MIELFENSIGNIKLNVDQEEKLCVFIEKSSFFKKRN